jgi:hypothetical protein
VVVILIFFELLGFLFISSCALLFHYVDYFFKPNKFTDILSTNNDSIWENLKVVVLPIILWTFIELPAVSTNKNVLLATIIKLFITMALLFVIYYSSQVILKKKPPLLKGIAIYVASFIGSITAYMILSMKTVIDVNLIVTISILVIFIIIYLVLSLVPPKIFLFQDPDTKVYGKN